MLVEIVSSAVMAGVLGWTILDKQGANEGSKIQRIAANCGLTIKDGSKTMTIHLLRKRRHPWGTEYVYKLPLGLSFEDAQKKQRHLEDGLNHKRGLLDVTFDDFKRLQLRADLLEQIKKIFSGTKQRKEITLDYDGTLRINVYREPLPEMVPFNNSTLQSCSSGWTVSLGESRTESVRHDFERIPHMVVAGTTRYGKSVFLKNTVTTLIHNHTEHVVLTLIDLKGGLAFNRFSNTRQVRTVAKDSFEALEALQAIQEEMKRRQAEYLDKGFEDIREAGQKQRHFIIIDEAAELASQGEPDKDVKKVKVECEKIISEIARIGGGLGYRLIFATQYPTADTLPRQVKQNCDARLCFRLQTGTASQVVLDESGAESLPFIKGRAIYRTDRKVIVQTPFIENDFIDRTIRPHITIKPRKERPKNESGSTAETLQGRSNTLVIEET
ncbi:FtsK/SpoIIIE domain-containing protein [Paenibacillus sp. TAB 01]|uniref:FtsK/SpoIIIE domain-containing protein n=1 Tax=Paenibacillus sp. TAB 01 TaxID=3368988 RepID=UPI003751E7B5